MNNKELLDFGLKKFGIETNETMLNNFKMYRELLSQWNEFMNLTGITEEREVYIKHFLDSVSCAKDGYVKDSISIIDVGTGAGFPGIPLKISFPNIKLTLLDSLNKRINFLKEVSNKLELKNIQFIHGRAEDFGRDLNYREVYDVATARAVAGLPVLMEFCAPFVKEGGYFICLKGPNANMELTESKAAADLLGLIFVEKIDVELPDTDLKHNILVFKKVNKTPDKYPRKAGKPLKNPIK